MIWDKEHECMDRAELQLLQLRRLQETVARAYYQVPLYRQRMDEIGVKPEDILSLDDVRRLPFTTKDDLRDNYPYGMFAAPLEDVVRIHASSGTTGKPTVVGYTRRDLETWSELVARIVTLAGVEARDVAQVVFGYGLFTGAFGLHYGLERVGAAVVPASGGNTEKQLMLMEDFGTTVLVGTPSYALYMVEEAERIGLDPCNMRVRLGLFGAEASTEEMRFELERRWGIKATDNYGLSEVMGPGVAGECLEQNGMHLNEDHFLVEILDPKTLRPVAEGEVGEVAITTLTKEGLPMLRYRTKDISCLNTEPCSCGRTTGRIEKIRGRTDDMLIVRGVNVFPSQIESVLMHIEGLAPQYQIMVRKMGYLDDLEIQVEVSEERFTGRFPELEKLEDEIKRKLQTVLSINARVKLVEPRSLVRSSGKAQRVIDLRNQGITSQ